MVIFPAIILKIHLKIHHGEIIGVNSNSYETIKTVLENLREEAGVGKGKHGHELDSMASYTV